MPNLSQINPSAEGKCKRMAQSHFIDLTLGSQNPNSDNEVVLFSEWKGVSLSKWRGPLYPNSSDNETLLYTNRLALDNLEV